MTKYLGNQPFSSKPATNAYRDNYEATFGKKPIDDEKPTLHLTTTEPLTDAERSAVTGFVTKFTQDALAESIDGPLKRCPNCGIDHGNPPEVAVKKFCACGMPLGAHTSSCAAQLLRVCGAAAQEAGIMQTLAHQGRARGGTQAVKPAFCAHCTAETEHLVSVALPIGERRICWPCRRHLRINGKLPYIASHLVTVCGSRQQPITLDQIERK